MYFSVITPEESLLRQAAHELAQCPYAEHQWLWKFFPSSKDQTRDFIFRRHEIGQMPRFYVVSQRQPKAFSEAWHLQSRVYDPQLQEGQRLAFQLHANPTISRKNGAGKSQRHDVVMQAKRQLLEERGFSAKAKWADWKDKDSKPLLYELVQKHCAAWIDSIAERNGFEIARTPDAPRLEVDCYEQNKASKADRNIRFSAVDFSGELLVTEPEKFQQALFNGIGPAKAFGCGLLLVRRV
ncbi:MAG: type I-E CRISPR-associated protein Cas6/Cse3/CasE [Pseudomonadota bacterium]